MRIASVKLTGFRNFDSATINFAEKTLVVGANDVGKTNLLHAVRLLLDRTVSEAELEPRETDFHINLEGKHADQIVVEVKLADITQDAVISRLKGHVSEAGETLVVYVAERKSLTYKIFAGHSPEACEEIDGRYYLKHIHFKYVESCRDINQYIQREKRFLLKMAKQKRTAEEEAADGANEASLQDALRGVTKGINELSYVSGATSSINDELKNISHHNADYAVGLEAQVLDFSAFIERLGLGASAGGRKVGLGGDGRNNQILVSLWKAKSELEHDSDSEVIIYCIEEPEAHLHPHQQRKLARYLVEKLHGQVLVSTHSPQIASEFRPDGIVRLFEKHRSTIAASEGCSSCIEEAWLALGYRMSILPAEAFFADVALLVEGPSEVLFYHALAEQLGIDLDFHNVSILSVEGVDFGVYVAILNAMEIPWVVRTDNDVSKVPHSNPPKWQFAGLNRALRLADEEEYLHHESIDSPTKLEAEWEKESQVLNPKGIYVARIDLENDLAEECPDALLSFSEEEDITKAIAYMQQRKAIRMGEFISAKAKEFKSLSAANVTGPLHHVVKAGRAGK
jgi:putative ATP-dependent endonuclease of OLD family